MSNAHKDVTDNILFVHQLGLILIPFDVGKKKEREREREREKE